MREVEILIIGGGAAGTSAAEMYRFGGGTGDVVIVSDEAHPLYSRVLLPHAAKGKIEPEKVFLKQESWYAEKKIELWDGRTVLRLDFKHKTALVDPPGPDAFVGTGEIVWKKLVIAVGGKPRKWEADKAHLPGVLQLQTYEDALALREKLTPESRMAIVGSGFIAIEFAAACVSKGASAVLFNRGPHFWTTALGEKIAHDVQARLEKNGIEVRNGAKVDGAIGEEAVEGVKLSDGETLACDLIGLGLGIVTPMDPFGDLRGDHGLVADAYLQAKHADVWIAGDCAEFDDEVTGLRRLVGNWTNAVAQGRHVGQALLGRHEKFIMLTNYSTAVFPGVHLMFMGESKMLPGIERFECELGPSKRIEFRLKAGRTVGVVLLNAPDQRAACATLITSGVPLKGREKLLTDPAVPLDAF